MSANVETRAGRKSMFSVRQSVWHDPANAVVIPDNPSFEKALEIARLDYPLAKCPTRIVFEDGSQQDSELSFAIVRTDTRAELGKCGPDYVPLANVDAFGAAFRQLVDDGKLQIETAGVLGAGERAWMLAKLDEKHFGPDTQETIRKEGLNAYAFSSADHTGKGANTNALTFIRAVCANTVGMIEAEVDHNEARGDRSRHERIIHTGEAIAKTKEAADRLFGDLVARAEKATKAYRAMRECKLTPEQFEAVIVNTTIGVHPTKRPKWNPEARMAGAVVDRWETKQAALETAWHYGTGHTGDDSAWEAYNGAVEMLDHNTDLWPNRAGVYRTASLLTGTLRRTKDALLDRVLAHMDGRGLIDHIVDNSVVDNGALLDGILASTN